MFNRALSAQEKNALFLQIPTSCSEYDSPGSRDEKLIRSAVVSGAGKRSGHSESFLLPVLRSPGPWVLPVRRRQPVVWMYIGLL